VVHRFTSRTHAFLYFLDKGFHAFLYFLDKGFQNPASTKGIVIFSPEQMFFMPTTKKINNFLYGKEIVFFPQEHI
jgi:hypothetical protein